MPSFPIFSLFRGFGFAFVKVGFGLLYFILFYFYQQHNGFGLVGFFREDKDYRIPAAENESIKLMWAAPWLCDITSLLVKK